MSQIHKVHFLLAGPVAIDRRFTLPGGRYLGELSFHTAPGRMGTTLRQLDAAWIHLTAGEAADLGHTFKGRHSGSGIDVAKFVKSNQVACEEYPDAGENLAF